jgi:outer membrane protein TolC
MTTSASKIIIRLIPFSILFAFQIALGQTASSPDSALQTILNGLEGTRITLRQAVESGAANATALRSAEATYLAAEGSVRREEGFYDPQVFFNVNHLDNNQPTSSLFSGAPILNTQQTSSQAGVRVNLPIGTRIEAGINTTRLATNSQLASLNPEYDASGSISLRQPLLGGFAASARKKLSTAEAGRGAEKARFDEQVIAVKGVVERSYWDLYAAERDYAVQRLTRDRAEQFLKETELRAQTGLVGKNQVASAKTFLAEQELLLYERDEQLGRQSDLLASLIGIRPEAPASRYVPVDVPPGDVVVGSVDSLVGTALRNNLDLQASKKDIDAARALADAAQWEALPSVDVVGAVGGNALLGNSQVVSIPGFAPYAGPGGTFGDALQQVFKRDYPSWSVGVEVSFPIGLRSGLGEHDRLQAQVVGAEQRSIEISRVLEQQVRAAYRELSNGKGRLTAAKNGVDAAQEQVRIGLIEFRTGRATAFELVRLGEDFAVAQQRYSDALVRTAKAAATLKQLLSENSTESQNQ